MSEMSTPPRSEPVKDRLNGVNRAVLTLLALLLLAAGVIMVLLGFGLFFLAPGSAVLPAVATTWVEDRPWLWWVAAAVSLAIALLGLRWLIAQLRTDGVGSFALISASGSDGLTQVRSSGVTEAVEDDAESIQGVERASARVAGHDVQRVELTVTTTEEADMSAVRRGLEDQTVSRLRAALDPPDLPVQIEIRPGAQRAGSRTVL